MNSGTESDRDALLTEGKKIMRTGKFDEAEQIFRSILEDEPQEPDALHLLGLVRFQIGYPEEAVTFINQAIAHARPNEDYLYNLGRIYKMTGRLADALEKFQQALVLKPDYTDAHINLGDTLKELGRLEDAVDCYRKALDIKPDFAEALNNLGNMLKALRRLDEAIASYHKAIAIKPDFAEAHNNLGNALQDFGELDEATSSYQQALANKPDFAEAHSNLGNVLNELGRQDEALASFHKALAIKPDYAEGHFNLGIAFQRQGKLDEAVIRYRKAIAIRPDYVGAYNNLGHVFQDLGNLDEALASYHKAVAINPNFYEAERNLLFVILYVPGLSPDDIFAEHLRFSEKHTQDIAKPIEKLTNDPTPDRRLRIGYLSSDFRNHPVGANVLPLIASYDRANFEIFCYADISRPDAMTERFQSFVENWIPIDGKSDADVAGMIRADGIDILVSLAGHFDRNRPLICAHRAAPVQVSYHDGATSGLGEMDYWLTDGFLHPPDTKELFTEELQRLPVFYQYPPMEEAPPVGTLPTDKEGFVTFGSFNNPAKVNDEVIGLWAEVLKSVPGSRLLLKYKNWYAQGSLQESLIKRFTTLGVGHDRVLFEASPDTLMGHLRRYEMIDIALDPFPFNGATTTFQALWMGVPVITLAGETFISRAAGSILHHVGLDDLTVDTPEAYVACARNLAGDIERLKKLRVELRGRVAASPLCDAPAYALCIEAAYLEMWRKWCSRHENTL